MDIYFVFNLNLKFIVDLYVLRIFFLKKDFENFNWGICIFKLIYKVLKYFVFIYVLKLNKFILLFLVVIIGFKFRFIVRNLIFILGLLDNRIYEFRFYVDLFCVDVSICIMYLSKNIFVYYI